MTAVVLRKAGWEDVRDMPDVVATLTEDLVSRGVDRESAEQRLEALDPDGDFSDDFEDLDFQRTGDCPAR